MALPWILIQYGTDGVVPSNPATNGGPPPWGLIGYGTNGAAVVPIVPTTPPVSGGVGGITSSTKRKPAVYVDGIRRVQRELKQIKSFEELKRALEPQKAVETAPPLLIASLPVDPEELRAKEIERQLQLMRDDDDEAVALLLLN